MVFDTYTRKPTITFLFMSFLRQNKKTLSHDIERIKKSGTVPGQCLQLSEPLSFEIQVRRMRR